MTKLSTNSSLSRLLSKHICLQRFFPKFCGFFYCLQENAFLTHFLPLKHTLPIANTCEYYGLVIKYTKSHRPNLCIKVGNTPLSLPCWWVILIFFVTIHDSVGRSCSILKFYFYKKLSNPFFMDGVQLLLFNTWSLGLPGAHLVNLRRKNDRINLGATQLFSTQDTWIRNPAP